MLVKIQKAKVNYPLAAILTLHWENDDVHQLIQLPPRSCVDP